MKIQKLIFITGFCFFSCKSFGQHVVRGSSDPAISCEALPFFLDSLKASILKDTVKFINSDIFTRGGLISNRNRYAPLIVINGKYFYKLDIITPSQVVQFVNEYIDLARIKNVRNLNKEEAGIYGSNGHLGAILITMKKNATFDSFVAGFRGSRLKGGNNFLRKG